MSEELERLCYEAAQAGETWSSLARRRGLRRERVRNLARRHAIAAGLPWPIRPLSRRKRPPKPRRLIQQHLAGYRQELAQLDREWCLGRSSADPSLLKARIAALERLLVELDPE